MCLGQTSLELTVVLDFEFISLGGTNPNLLVPNTWLVPWAPWCGMGKPHCFMAFTVGFPENMGCEISVEGDINLNEISLNQ